MKFPRFLKIAAPAILLGLALGLIGCGDSGRESGLEWKGAPIEVLSRLDRPGPAQVSEAGFPLPGSAPRRLLKVAPTEGTDSLTLLEFGGDVDAYAALQELATHPGDFAAGFAVRGDRVYFRRGRWIGSMGAWAWKGISDLEGGLALPDAPAGPYTLPAEFGSLMQQGRIEGSERILTREFLGLAVNGPIFSARMNCRNDTALLYASPHLNRDFGLRAAKLLSGRIDSSGKDLEVFVESGPSSPLQMRFSDAGGVGVEGCFDEKLTKFWTKMQVRALKSLN